MGVNKERVQLLVNALRSGLYLQGTQNLEFSEPGSPDVVRRCCLGVGCRVAMANGLKLDITKSQREDERTITYFERDSGQLPIRVMNWYGLSNTDPVLGGPTAISMNDLLGADFDAIADAFEAEFLTDKE